MKRKVIFCSLFLSLIFFGNSQAQATFSDFVSTLLYKKPGGETARVNLFSRQYQLSNVDMSVMVPGGYLKVYRRYTNSKWQHEFESLRLDVSKVKKGEIRKNNLVYKQDSTGFFKFKNFTIEQIGDRYRWENKQGNYNLFSKDGMITEVGKDNESFATYKSKQGRLISINDRNDNVIFKYDYNQGGNVVRVSDNEGREIRYKWDGENLVAVKDYQGNVTVYEYDSKGQIIKKRYEGGVTINIDYHPDRAVKSVLSDDGEGNYFSYKHLISENQFYTKATNTTGDIDEFWFDATGKTVKKKRNGKLVVAKRR